jgi:hypothetical protein
MFKDATGARSGSHGSRPRETTPFGGCGGTAGGSGKLELGEGARSDRPGGAWIGMLSEVRGLLQESVHCAGAASLGQQQQAAPGAGWQQQASVAWAG